MSFVTVAARALALLVALLSLVEIAFGSPPLSGYVLIAIISGFAAGGGDA